MNPGSKRRTLSTIAILFVQSILWFGMEISDVKPDASPFGLPNGLLQLTPFGMAPIYVLVFGFAGYWLIPRKRRSVEIANWIIFIAGMSLIITIYSTMTFTTPMQQGN